MNVEDFFLSPAIVIVTGASGGYGNALAKCFSKQLKENSVLILTGRNIEKMQILAKDIDEYTSNSIRVEVIACDLKNVKSIDAFFEKLYSNIDRSAFQRAVLLNNAGSLGNVKLTVDQYEYSSMKENFEMNVTNTLYFSTVFLNSFKNHKLCVVNISSLCAVKAFPTCGMYCIGKAARDMAFKVVAAERPDIRVLNWAPGPMPTEMFVEMSQAADKGVSEALQELVTNKTYVKCEDSAEKLIALLKTNSFVSGEHIDYYDV